MDFLTKLARKINGNVITKNLVLAACALIVFIFVTSILLNLFTRHGQVRNVPDFSGMTVEEALRAGKGSSLRIEVNDSLYVPAYEGGIILDQDPAPNAKVKSGRRIFVTINSFNQKTVEVPYVAGYSLRQAKFNLEQAGLEIDELIYQSDLATNNVLKEFYKGKPIGPGSKVEAEVGSGVTLVVGLGDDATTQSVPMLVGFPAREAKSRLWEAGFNIGTVSRDEDITLLNEKEARVYVQSPAPGSRQAYGSRVNFSLTLDEDKTAKGKIKADKEAQAAVKAAEEEAAAAREETPAP